MKTNSVLMFEIPLLSTDNETVLIDAINAAIEAQIGKRENIQTYVVDTDENESITDTAQPARFTSNCPGW